MFNEPYWENILCISSLSYCLLWNGIVNIYAFFGFLPIIFWPQNLPPIELLHLLDWSRSAYSIRSSCSCRSLPSCGSIYMIHIKYSSMTVYPSFPVLHFLGGSWGGRQKQINFNWNIKNIDIGNLAYWCHICPKIYKVMQTYFHKSKENRSIKRFYQKTLQSV